MFELKSLLTGLTVVTAAGLIGSAHAAPVSIDFNAGSVNHSGEALNADGLQLPGQVGPWNDLDIAGGAGNSVDTGSGIFSLGGGYLTYAQGGFGHTTYVRYDVAYVTSGSVSWSLTGLVDGAAYNLILYSQFVSDLPAGNALTDYSIIGHDAGNGVGAAVTLDADNDGNFTNVIATGGEIHGTFALRSGMAIGSLSGLQFEAVPEPSSLALIGLGGLCLLRRRRI